jgi:hypothetical protein
LAVKQARRRKSKNKNWVEEETTNEKLSHDKNATSPIRFAEMAKRPCLDVAERASQCEIRRNETQPTASQASNCEKPKPVSNNAQTQKERA